MIGNGINLKGIACRTRSYRCATAIEPCPQAEIGCFRTLSWPISKVKMFLQPTPTTSPGVPH
eukprot:6476493-Amphidinium_carterae.1